MLCYVVRKPDLFLFFFCLAVTALNSRDTQMSCESLLHESLVNETKMFSTLYKLHFTVGLMNCKKTTQSTSGTQCVPEADLVLHFTDKDPFFISQYDQGHFLQLPYR